MSDFLCPRCGTFVHQLPGNCPVCGTLLKSPPPGPERPPSRSERGNSHALIAGVICAIGWVAYLAFPPGLAKAASAAAVMTGPIAWIVIADQRNSAGLFVVSLTLAALFALGLLFLGVVQSVAVVGH